MYLRKTLCSALCLVMAGSLFAQKKAMDHDVYDSWQRVATPQLTADGAILSYQIAEQEGDMELIIRRVFDGREVRIPRGTGFLADGTWGWCLIKPEYQATRQAKIAKKKADQMPKDSLALINLTTLDVRKFADVKAFKTGADAMPFAAYTFDKGLVVVRPADGAVDTLKNVDQYIFARDGRRMAITFKKDKKDSLSRNEIVLYDPATGERTSLDSDKQYYGGMTFDDSGRQLAFLASTDSVKDGNKHCDVLLSEDGKAPRTVIGQDYSDRNGWTFNENSAPFFSRSGRRLFAGIAPFTGPKDTTSGTGMLS